MPNIFISYRRQDSGGYVRALARKLRKYYGVDSIFRDLDNMGAGDDFIKMIEKAVSECKVLITVIGPHWSTIKDEHGARRLNNPHDFVRLEIESALKRDIPVIPVTVNGAVWPPTENLPESLTALLTRLAHELSDKQSRWDYDINQLIKHLDKIDGLALNVNTPKEPSTINEIGKSRVNNRCRLSVGIIIIVILGLIMFATENNVGTEKSTANNLRSDEINFGSNNLEQPENEPLVNGPENNHSSRKLSIKVDDKVLAVWKFNGCLYPATVLETNAGSYSVNYIFSEQAELDEDELLLIETPSEIKLTEKVFFALNADQSKWAPGRITDQRADKYLVKPDSDATCRTHLRHRWVTADELISRKQTD